jgi:RNA polymerase sporulation-specific sigma factor
MLSDTETIKYLRLAKNGDNNSKEILIKNNVLLVKSIANRFRNKGVDYDDLFQLGSMGLLKAIYNFDESFCVKFSTYAVPMIIGEIKRFLRDDGEIKISRIIKYNAYKIAQFSEEYQLKNGSEPTVHEISKNLSISLEDVVLALDSTKLTVSLYETTVDSEEKTQSLIDKIPSEDTEDSRIDSIYVKQLLSRLNEREKQVVTLRYFKDKTQGEVSKILGVSQVQVSRLESKIIKKLKTIAEKK